MIDRDKGGVIPSGRSLRQKFASLQIPDLKRRIVQSRFVVVVAALFVLCSTIQSARAETLRWNWSAFIAGSTDAGEFGLDTGGLDSGADLTKYPGSNFFSYVWRGFTPAVTGNYTIGITNASYDPVMFLLSGQSTFPANPSDGLFAFNDDGSWDYDGNNYYFSWSFVDPSAADYAPERMPLLRDLALTAGTDYILAITSHNALGYPIPLPVFFFIAGPAPVWGYVPPNVPEIDPAGLGSMLALLGGGLGLCERRRKQA